MDKPRDLPSTTEGRMVQVTDTRERDAVRNGSILGWVYSDDDVWADLDQLTTWRQMNNNG